MYGEWMDAMPLIISGYPEHNIAQWKRALNYYERNGDIEEANRIKNLIEKEKNKELEEENIKYERANDYLRTLNHKYYEDNVTLLRKNGKVDILADNIHFKYIDMVENYIPKSKVRDLLKELNNEYIKQEEIFNKHFEKENRDMQDYYIQKEATNIMQEISWLEGKIEELLEGDDK